MPRWSPIVARIFRSIRARSLERETYCEVRIRVPDQGQARARYHHPGPATRKLHPEGELRHGGELQPRRDARKVSPQQERGIAMSVANAPEVMREAVKKHSTWYLVQSALMILAGALALLFPSLSSTAIVFYVGWLLIIGGVLQAIGLIDAHDVPHFWLQFLSVALFIVVGLLFLRLGNIVGSSILDPEAGLLSLTLLLTVLFTVEGVSKVIFSLTIRPLSSWAWVFASGMIGILLAVYLSTNTPLAALWLLGVLLGIQLISEGVALGILAWRAR